MLNRLGKRQIFVVIIGVSGDQILRKAHRTHGTPFIMIPAEPDACQILHLAVFENLLRIQMVVIVKNGHFFSRLVVQCFRRIGLQQKVSVHKRFHMEIPPF